MSHADDEHLRQVRADFDQIASFGDESGADRYNAFLVSLVPGPAADVLEVGCGLGRLSAAIAGERRKVVGIDVSPAMIARGREENASPRVTFVCGDFSEHDFGPARFDCVVSAATLHHIPLGTSIQRMQDLLRPGGRLIVHDMRRDDGVADWMRAYCAFADHSLRRLVRTGRPFPPAHVQAAWDRHGEGEHYLCWREVRNLTTSLLPGAQAFYHWMWRYTIVWDKPAVEIP